jgi:hypothetical protein
VLGATVAAFVVTALLFDPEQRFIGRGSGGPIPAPAPHRGSRP